MRTESADVVVVGCGTMGSLALWRLAARGIRAVGVEQFEPGHDRGSGHGESRIIRTAYYEGPQYVPLVREAFDLWRQLEQETGTRLLTVTGGLMIGRPDTGLVQGVLRSARIHGLSHRVLDATEVRRRYPQLLLRDDEVAVFEQDAGFLRPELCIVSAARCATGLGARLLTRLRVRSVRAGAGCVRVDAGEVLLEAPRAILCAGAWTPQLAPAAVQVQRKVLTWFRAEDPGAFSPDRFPIFIWERDGLQWYGLPTLDGETVKIVIHRGGTHADPDRLDRAVHPEDLAPIQAIVAEAMEGLGDEVVRSQVCMYSLTPDEHFLVGNPAAMPGVTLLGGFSGHGFKFAPVLADVAADLALEGRTRRDIASFDPDRFTGPLPPPEPGTGPDRPMV